MATIYEVADEYRAALLTTDRQAALELLRAYAPAWQRIRARLDKVLAEIEDLRRAGQRPSALRLLHTRRYQELQAQIERELRLFGQIAGRQIEAGQAEAVAMAHESSRALVLTSLGPGVSLTWARAPLEAVRHLVGFLQDGSPLSDLLNAFGPEASAAAREALLTGLTLGENPRAVGYRLRSALSETLYRAQTIARTEMLRSYREAALCNYRANDDIVKGWLWHSALGTRTCGACWAMHGSFHTLDERLDDHPNGRCAPLPATKSVAELGLANVPETRPVPHLGTELFWRLPEEQRLKIIGPGKLAALKSGQIELRDLVQRHYSERWGTWRGEASLAEALENASRRRAA